MRAPLQTPMPGKDSHAEILSVVLIYAAFASLWILLSDKTVELLFSDPAQIVLAGTLKGGIFVVVTSLLLYGLMRRLVRAEPALPLQASRNDHLYARLPAMLVFIAILALSGAGIVHTFTHLRDKEVARLQTIAEFKARQIADWLRDRRADAELVRNSPFFAATYRRWSESGKSSARDVLQARLEQYRRNMGLAAISLLDEQGQRVWGSAALPQEIASPLQDAIRLGATDHEIRRVGPYRGVKGTQRLDFVVPLAEAGAHPPLIVLHIDLSDWLYAALQAWPVPSASGETLLVRRDGDQVVYLNELRHRKDSALNVRIPLAAQYVLAAQVLRGEAGPGSIVEGEDYRGVATLGVVQPIQGTDWSLIAKLDRQELYEGGARDAVWIALTGTLASLMTVTGYLLLRQRQQLAIAVGLQQSQAERLQALQLLAAIADSSDDAIFAKDREGRYILFNQAAANIVGKPVETILGQDDHAIFPKEQADMLMAVGARVLAENRIHHQEEVLDTPNGPRTFFATKGPLRDRNGEVIGIFGIARDITEQKKAELALRTSEETYRSLFNNMLNSVVHARVIFAGGKPVDMEYLATNPAFAAVTGIAEPVVGRRISEIIPGYAEHNPESLETFGRVAATGVAARWEHYLSDLERWFSFMIYSPAFGEVVIISENITERKQAEIALRESESRFRALVEQSLAGIYIIQDGRFRYVNPGFVAIFGYDTARAIVEGVTVADLVRPEDREKVAENIRHRLQGEVPDIHYTFGGLRRDGSPIDVEVHGRVFDYQGAPAVIGLILDITARKAAEDLLRESELRFHDIVEASADWVWEVDAEARYTYVSESVHNLLGYTAEEVLGKTPFDLMPPEEAAKVKRTFFAIAACRAPFRDLDNINCHKDGTLRHVSTNGMPILDGEGNLLGYRGLDRDITARRLDELALRESEQRFRSLFENNMDGVLLTTPDGGILAANPEAQRIFGYSEDELRGIGRKGVVDASDPRLAEALEQRDRIGQFRGELTLLRKDGNKFAAELSSLVFEDVSGRKMTSMIVRDISERRAAEEALRRQTEELVRHNAELERFNRATVGRELDMIALKQQVNELSRELGREPVYPLAFIDKPNRGDLP